MATDPVTLEEMNEHARRHIESGRYESMSEVVRAGFEALDREEAEFSAMLREKVAEARADPRPSIPFNEAIAQVWAATRNRPE